MVDDVEEEKKPGDFWEAYFKRIDACKTPEEIEQVKSELGLTRSRIISREEALAMFPPNDMT